MDPITLLIIGISGAAAAGLTASSIPIVRHVRFNRARELLTRPIIGAQGGSDAPRSVFDLFRDLGSSEYAIEVMRHMDLVPENEEQLEFVASNFSDAIASFGGYDLMISSLKETIKEYSQESGKEISAEDMRKRLTLVAPHQTDALLPSVDRPVDALPEGEPIKQLEEQTTTSKNDPFDGKSDVQSLDEVVPRLHATVDEALAELFGSNRDPNAGMLNEGSGGLAAIVLGGVVGSLTTGGFWDGVSRFVHRRKLKQMRSKLNDELAGLSLDVFHAPAQVTQQIDRNLELMLQEKRWVVERRRREVDRHKKLPKKQRSLPLLALKRLASQEARESLTQAERDVKKLRTQITRHRRSGRHDLAGFLLYVNRADLLRGVDAFSNRIQAIEDAGNQLRQALLAELPNPQQPEALPPSDNLS